MMIAMAIDTCDRGCVEHKLRSGLDLREEREVATYKEIRRNEVRHRYNNHWDVCSDLSAWRVRTRNHCEPDALVKDLRTGSATQRDALLYPGR